MNHRVTENTEKTRQTAAYAVSGLACQIAYCVRGLACQIAYCVRGSLSCLLRLRRTGVCVGVLVGLASLGMGCRQSSTSGSDEPAGPAIPPWFADVTEEI